MRWLGVLFGLMSSGLVCSRVVKGPVPASSNPSYSTNALLNDSTWFSSAYAAREQVDTTNGCTKDRFVLVLSTDIPINKSYPEPKGGITGCMGVNCQTTKELAFRRVPLAVGRYALAALQVCMGTYGNRSAGEYTLIVGGDVIINHYYPRGVSVRKGNRIYASRPGTDTSWIDVTRYDPKTKRVEGTFDVTLVGKNNELAHFSKGVFRATLTP